MHSSRMRTVRSSSRLSGGGCLPQCMVGYPLGADTPGSRHCPPGADTPKQQTPPGSRHPHSGTRHPHPSVDRQMPVKT